MADEEARPTEKLERPVGRAGIFQFRNFSVIVKPL
jgi:hypothetical protein